MFLQLRLHKARYSVFHHQQDYKVSPLFVANKIYRTEEEIVESMHTALSSEATPKMVKIRMKVKMNSHMIASRSVVELEEY